MDAVDYLLDGLEAALELERELGVRSLDCDRTLVEALQAEGARHDGEGAVVTQASQYANNPPTPTRTPTRTPTPAPTPIPQPPTLNPQPSNLLTPNTCSFCFLHDRPLSPRGIEMMAKIITALGKTDETAPIVLHPPLPKATVYVVLGGLALKKFFPGVAAGPGQWARTSEGADILVTYSPEYILRFGTVTPAVQKIKQDMWAMLKSVLKRI